MTGVLLLLVLANIFLVRSASTPQDIELPPLEHIFWVQNATQEDFKNVLNQRVPFLVKSATGKLKYPWDTNFLKTIVKDENVNVMLYDGAIDAAQNIFLNSMGFTNFLDLLRVKFEAAPEAGGSTIQSAVPYLLISDRKGEHNVAVNPNGVLSSETSFVSELLRMVHQEFEANYLDIPRPLPNVAWTSLRIGGRYRYPTHIDCFENIIIQLHGTKTINVFPPESISKFQPQPRKKHWPKASLSTEDTLSMERARKIVLQPGDLCFIPGMYFHNVATEASLSITANQYHRLPNDIEWANFYDNLKAPEWIHYEKKLGQQFC